MISEKLKNIQTELKAPKKQYNSFGKYKYRNCEDIMVAVKPLLIKYNCSLTVYDEVELIGDRYYIKAVATLTDAENGDQMTTSAYAREPDVRKGMDESQITGASSSYARKYCLNGLFLIDDNQDTDTTNKGNTAKPDELVQIQTEIIKVCSAVGGQKNEELMATLKKYVASSNPRQIKSVDKAKSCLEEIKKIKPI